MKDPNKRYSRIDTVWLGMVLVIIGTWAAIIMLPTMLVAMALFVIVGGSGLYIAYKRKRLLRVVGFTSLIPAWAYLLVLLNPITTISGALLVDLAVVFVALLVSLVLVFLWAVLRKFAPKSKILAGAKRPVLLGFFTLLVVVPFVVAVPLDYNVRADISPREATRAKIADKYMGGNGDEEWPIVVFETIEEGLRFRFPCPVWDWSFYDRHEIGDFCQIIVRRGALGYPWMEGYND